VSSKLGAQLVHNNLQMGLSGAKRERRMSFKANENV
jgi:hypothetical protein